MKKESKEMLKTIISNQELIMKALKIEIPAKELVKKAEVKKQPVKKAATKKATRKTTKK